MVNITSKKYTKNIEMTRLWQLNRGVIRVLLYFDMGNQLSAFEEIPLNCMSCQDKQILKSRLKVYFYETFDLTVIKVDLIIITHILECNLDNFFSINCTFQASSLYGMQFFFDKAI